VGCIFKSVGRDIPGIFSDLNFYFDKQKLLKIVQSEEALVCKMLSTEKNIKFNYLFELKCFLNFRIIA
jgi:hypothetical protein